MAGNRSPTAKFTVGYSYKNTLLTHPVVRKYRKGLFTVRTRKFERDVLRFHWVRNCDPSVIEINKFTGLVFGLTQSPLKFENILKEHFQYYIKEHPALIAAVSEDI